MIKWDLSKECKGGLTSENQLIYHINKIKSKNYMIFPDTEKTIWKNAALIHDKNSQQTRDRR